MSGASIRHLVLMGVSGSGKSSVGTALSAQTGLPYLDGDDLHPAANIDKMRQGIALTDLDRWPWLDLCGARLAAAPDGLILGCSALRRSYRDRLRQASGLADLLFVHLSGDAALLGQRMGARPGHYMPASLLVSQLSTLEPPQDDEQGITIGIDQPLAAIVKLVTRRIG